MHVYISKSKLVKKNILNRFVDMLHQFPFIDNVEYYDAVSHGEYRIHEHINSNVDLVICLLAVNENTDNYVRATMGRGSFQEQTEAANLDIPVAVVTSSNAGFHSCHDLDSMMFDQMDERDWVHYVDVEGQKCDEVELELVLDIARETAEAKDEEARKQDFIEDCKEREAAFIGIETEKKKSHTMYEQRVGRVLRDAKTGKFLPTKGIGKTGTPTTSYKKRSIILKLHW